MPIGKDLVKSGALKEEQLELALEKQRETGELLGTTLLKLNYITEEALARALAEQAGVPFVTLAETVPAEGAAALIDEPFARRHALVALGLDDNGVLRAVQADPSEVLVIDALQRKTGYTIDVACATRTEVMALIDRVYGTDTDVKELVKEGLAALDKPEMIKEGRSADAPVVRLISVLISDAVTKGATDLHIEPEDEIIRLRHRIDGVLMPGQNLAKELLPALVSRLKVLSGLDIAEARLPQEGRMTHEVDGRRVDLRIATFPTVYGEKVAIRILEKEKLIRGLGDLGFSKKNHELFRDVLSKSRGMILVTGPTGAGKTTTLYSALAFLAQQERNILTVEDPVEYELPKIRQTQIRPKAGFTFATAIRSLLRQDPDIIMVGEVRDPETAQLALRAALSGMLVFSTLHTPDSAGAIPRLMDMGLEPYLLASGIIAVIAQRLVRVICVGCRETVTYPAELLKKVGLMSDHAEFQRGRGCVRCNGTGYRGRTGVFEILVIDSAVHPLIRERADSKQIKEVAVRAGMKTLMDDALAKALFGVTTIEEVLRVAYE